MMQKEITRALLVFLVKILLMLVIVGFWWRSREDVKGSFQISDPNLKLWKSQFFTRRLHEMWNVTAFRSQTNACCHTCRCPLCLCERLCRLDFSALGISLGTPFRKHWGFLLFPVVSRLLSWIVRKSKSCVGLSADDELSTGEFSLSLLWV